MNSFLVSFCGIQFELGLVLWKSRNKKMKYYHLSPWYIIICSFLNIHDFNLATMKRVFFPNMTWLVKGALGMICRFKWVKLNQMNDWMHTKLRPKIDSDLAIVSVSEASVLISLSSTFRHSRAWNPSYNSVNMQFLLVMIYENVKGVLRAWSNLIRTELRTRKQVAKQGLLSGSYYFFPFFWLNGLNNYFYQYWLNINCCTFN